MQINENELASMSRAIELSRLGIGRTFPNPIVGAVITGPDGKILGEGFHAGQEHAEVLAIKAAANIPNGSTLFVTLEPCNHIGRTGPCVDAIISAGISKVIYAVKDPNQVASGGAERLRAAGIEVIEGALAEEAREANLDWLTKILKARPKFIWKIAATLDGKITAKDGTSKWITSEAARKDVALLRSTSDAILTSTTTVLLDNPSLTSKKNGANPVRIVMGASEIPEDFEVNSSASKTIYLKSREISKLIELTTSSGFNRVLVESGSTLGTALLLAGVIDELVLYQAPTLLGSGRSLVSDLGITTLEDRLDFEVNSVEQIGPDIKTVLLVKGGAN